MSSSVIAGLFTLLGIALTKGVDYLRDRRTHDAERLRIESDVSGEWSRALLVDQAKFRAELLEQIKELRDELKSHDSRCDEKIAQAIERSEADCEAKIDAKLASRDVEIRHEFEQRLRETSEVNVG